MLNVEKNEFFLVTGYSSTIYKALNKTFLMDIPIEKFIFMGRTQPEVRDGYLFIEVDFNDINCLKESIYKLKDKKIKYMYLSHGVLIGKSSIDYSFEEIQKTININVTSYLYILSVLGRNLVDNGATVLMSSVIAKNGSYDDIYSSSKALIESFMKSFVYKIGPHRINCIAPGITLNTKMTDVRTDVDNIEKKRKQTPLRKLGTPVDIANTIYFLLSNEAGHITKSVIPIDGGI